jgi:hypothetical protein
VHKTPIDHTLEAVGGTHTEVVKRQPLYDDRYSWVSTTAAAGRVLERQRLCA